MDASNLPSAAGLSRILDPIAECFTPEVARHVASLRTDSDVLTRIAELAEKANEGDLSQEEATEYEAYIVQWMLSLYLKPKQGPSRLVTRNRGNIVL